MDIFFEDPDDPRRPPADVRIRDFTIRPYPDGKRVRIYLEVTPFEKKPSGEITITDLDGNILATANIIETMTRKMELTLHLRRSPGQAPLHATADIFYQRTPDQDEIGESGDYELPERERVDMSQVTFTFPDPDA